MSVIKLNKWGNSLAVRLPKSILHEAGITSENSVEFEVSVNKNHEIILKQHQQPKNLKELFKGFDYKKYWHDWEKEHPNQSKEVDWGKPVGREVF